MGGIQQVQMELTNNSNSKHKQHQMEQNLGRGSGESNEKPDFHIHFLLIHVSIIWIYVMSGVCPGNQTASLAWQKL